MIKKIYSQRPLILASAINYMERPKFSRGLYLQCYYTIYTIFRNLPTIPKPNRKHLIFFEADYKLKQTSLCIFRQANRQLLINRPASEIYNASRPNLAPIRSASINRSVNYTRRYLPTVFK